ncbi:hypothetical protein NITHO_6480003 [Nitrolancea hollandica Lb]|uniref:RHS repeat-associated core domain-containing protein n=1 Tax=Nitrolancea hollandica Lb TaxID=1129897 RepID=I4EMS5_9BACT|nr:hypothetical protein NITHO_6480003 [Nitrolancea hollandica Lb]
MKIGQRYYDPSLGRWTQQDLPGSLTSPMTLNRYVYVGNNPCNAIDPSGRQSAFQECQREGVIGADVGAAGGFVTGLFTGPGILATTAGGGALGAVTGCLYGVLEKITPPATQFPG